MKFEITPMTIGEILSRGTTLFFSRLIIFAAIELSKASWLVALHLPSHDKISVFQVPGGDVDRLLAILERARETAKARSVLPTVEIHTCYEAGYGGFWRGMGALPSRTSRAAESSPATYTVGAR